MIAARLSLIAGFVATLSACAARTRLDALHPIPETVADTASDVRGTAADAARLGESDQLEIYATLVRDFFRPRGSQMRLIDTRPLAHRRSADDSVGADGDRADAIAAAVALRRVCPEDDDTACGSLRGGVLRFSAVYASSPDTAAVFATYTPVDASHARLPGPVLEMRFTLARGDSRWRIVSRVSAVAGPR